MARPTSATPTPTNQPRTLFAAGVVLQPAAAQTDGEGQATAVVEPAAMDALMRMGAYLRTLDTFEVTAETTRNEVAAPRENVEFGSRLDTKERLPDRLKVDVTSDRNERQYRYDGRIKVLWAMLNKRQAFRENSISPLDSRIRLPAVAT